MKNNKVVLYADDDADDRLLLSDAFEKVIKDYSLELFKDGFGVLDFLRKKTPPMPCLLILDLNMPGLSGMEVMERLRADNRYSGLPIVAFTTSSSIADKEACAAFGVEMLTKPGDLREFEATAMKLLSFC